jgi:hypothetical protein
MGQRVTYIDVPKNADVSANIQLPRINHPGREADHSLRSIAEDKNAWSYTSIPRIRLHSVVLN